MEQRKRVKYNEPSDESDIEKQKDDGIKFIPVPNDYVNNDLQYSKIRVDIDNKDFSFLVPSSVMIFLVKKGEGDPDDGLDELRELYDSLRGFEKQLIKDSSTCPQESMFAAKTRYSYDVYLINKLTRDGKTYDPETLENLCLNDKRVDARIRTIAMKKLGKSSSDLKEAKLEEMLEHVTVDSWIELKGEELEQVRCYAGSHYRLKNKYRDSSYYEQKGDRFYKKGTVEVEVFNRTVRDCLKEIKSIRRKKGKEISLHDDNLIKMYVNLKYLKQEGEELSINPSE